MNNKRSTTIKEHQEESKNKGEKTRKLWTEEIELNHAVQEYYDKRNKNKQNIGKISTDVEIQD